VQLVRTAELRTMSARAPRLCANAAFSSNMQSPRRPNTIEPRMVFSRGAAVRGGGSSLEPAGGVSAFWAPIPHCHHRLFTVAAEELEDDVSGPSVSSLVEAAEVSGGGGGDVAEPSNSTGKRHILPSSN
jgi:hypothetical protein